MLCTRLGTPDRPSSFDPRKTCGERVTYDKARCKGQEQEKQEKQEPHFLKFVS